MKLTKEVIEQLIMEELERLDEFKVGPFTKNSKIGDLRTKLGFTGNPESLAQPFNPDDWKDKSTSARRNAVQKNIRNNAADLAGLDKSPSHLEPEDIEKAFELDQNDPSFITANALKGSKISAIADAIKDITPGYQSQSITAPRSYTAGNASANFLKGIQSIFGSALANSDPATLLDELTQISEQVFDLSEIASMDQKTLLRKLLAMDYLQMLTFDMDSKRQGGYDFEGFLAMIFQGGVMGGENAGGDFTMGDGTMGSAKYVQDFKVGQSLAGYEAGDEVVYVVARKQSAETVDTTGTATRTAKKFPDSKARSKVNKTIQVPDPLSGDVPTSDKGTSDPDKILVMNIHAFRVEVTRKDESNAYYIVKEIDGTEIHPEAAGKLKGQTELSAGGGQVGKKVKPTEKQAYRRRQTMEASIIGQLRMRHGTGTRDTLKQFLSRKLEKSSDVNLAKQKQAYIALKSYFTNLFKLDNLTRDYIATDDTTSQQTKGNKILDAYDATDQQMVDLINMIRPAAKATATTKSGTRTKLEENKQNENNLDNILDKLIKEVILNR